MLSLPLSESRSGKAAEEQQMIYQVLPRSASSPNMYLQLFFTPTLKLDFLLRETAPSFEEPPVADISEQAI